MLHYNDRYNAQGNVYALFYSAFSDSACRFCGGLSRLRQFCRDHLAGSGGGRRRCFANRRLDDRLRSGNGREYPGAHFMAKGANPDGVVNARAALLVSGLQGVTLAQAIGVFIFANGLIVLCGVTGLFARLMKIIPHSLAAAMLAGILLRFGMQAFSSLQGNLLLCGSMLAAWLICKVCLPRFAVVAAMLAGSAVAALSGDVTGSQISWRFVAPAFIAPEFTPALLLSVGVPFFLVTMASQNAPGFATLQASGYRVPASSLIVATGGLALLLSPFGVYSICIAAITAAICQSPEAHPDPQKRWLAAAAAGVFYLLAGIFGGSITSLMSALPAAWIQMLAGLALLGTIGGSLFQALNHERERDAAVVTFLVTASGVELAGIGSAFWGLVLGGISYVLLSALRRA